LHDDNFLHLLGGIAALKGIKGELHYIWKGKMKNG